MSFNEEKVFGKGFYYSEGDIVIDSTGNLKLTEGPERAAQGIQILLLTQRGEDPVHPTTGLDFITLASNPSRLTSGEQLEYAKSLITEAILQDDRVTAVTSIEYNADESEGRSKTFDAVLTLFNDTDLSVQLVIEI